MTVQEALNNIKNAVFGRDVRQSIHDGIDTINKESKADMQKKQETINAYTGKMDLLNDKYEEQIKNMTLDSPSDAEIVDARRTSDNIIYSTLKQRLDEDKNSIWIREETTCNATLNEDGNIGLLEIDIQQIIADKDVIRITPVFKSGDGDTLTGAAFLKVEAGEKLTLTIDTAYYLSLYYDIVQDLGESQGPFPGKLTFPVNLNVKVSYPSPTEKKINEFVGNPENLETTSKTDLVSSINEINRNLLQKVFPVGAIYISVNSTDPGILFGGTWERWGNGRVPVGVSENETEFATSEKKDGEKIHKLTVQEIPSHSHASLRPMKYYEDANPNGVAPGKYTALTLELDNNKLTGNTGGGIAHNNLQPYITCYMWVRRQ